jgi:shikimate dehydrogenase
MRRYGLIGYPLTHSFSQRYFTEKFEREGIKDKDCTYSNFSLPQIGELTGVLADPELCGFNITIPYKEQVIGWLDEQDEVVQAVGACNCVRIRDGQLKGYNTDVIGFEQSFVPKLTGDHKKALVLGSGGAAKAVMYVLRRLGIDYRLITRANTPAEGSMNYTEVDSALLAEYTVIINTTPLGMHPRTEDCPPLPYEALTPRHYLFDLIYNPARTLFLQKGEERGAVVENGHEMLILQAEESWRIWNS